MDSGLYIPPKGIVAFIPVRGGSKGIPGKNIKNFNTKPLVYWTAKAASECQYIDTVYIATDSREIALTAEKLDLPKLKVIDRDPVTATDTATTESAMLDFASRVDFEYIVLIQATSPLLTVTDLTGGIEQYFNKGADSLFSAVSQTSFLWTQNGKFTMPMNYDPLHRPRRQDHAGVLVENGAFYITRKDLLIKTQCRISGNITSYIMSKDSFFEIDDVEDFSLLEELMRIKQCN
jgi:N-acylneuraminate cytidylyltransferase